MNLGLGEWREGKVRPIPGKAPHGRPVSRGISYPLWSLCDDPFDTTRFPLQTKIPGPSVCVFQAWRNLSGPMCFQTKTKNKVKTIPWIRTEPPPAVRPRNQAAERAGRIELRLIVRR
jgi:hypothetical protein